MRTFAIGDIHGGLKALKQLLETIKPKLDDTFIFLGDYVDGWSESAQVIQFLIQFSETHICIFIKGNHDVWCEDWLRTGEGESVWLMHGGEETVHSYSEFSEAKKETHLQFFRKMKLYHIDAEKRLYIHAGFTADQGVTEEQFTMNYYFDRTLWETALSVSQSLGSNLNEYPERFKQYHEIYIGHSPTIRYNSDKPMQAGNVWNIDTGAAFSGKLSAIDIETKKVYQSDEVQGLYPDERGRNNSPYRVIKKK